MVGGRRTKDRYGTPVGRPVPQAIDPWSGFKIDHADLVRQWDGQYTWSKTCDIRNPQDFVRGVKDNQALDTPRPESPDQFTAANIVWQSGAFMTTQEGGAILTQGIDPTDTL